MSETSAVGRPDATPSGPDARTILVTGASRGIGLWLVRHLLDDGHRVIAACRTPDRAVDLQALGVPIVQLDVTDDASIHRLAGAVTVHTGRLDLLVNNAGIKRVPEFGWEASAGPIPAMQRPALLAVFDTNVAGPILVTQSLSHLLAPGAVVLNVSSQLGSLSGNVGIDYAYNSSKAALNMATIMMTCDSALAGTAPVCLVPGWMDTDMAGSEAPLSTPVATREIADLIGRLDETFTGRFVDRFGDDVAW